MQFHYLSIVGDESVPKASKVYMGFRFVCVCTCVCTDTDVVPYVNSLKVCVYM